MGRELTRALRPDLLISQARSGELSFKENAGSAAVRKPHIWPRKADEAEEAAAVRTDSPH